MGILCSNYDANYRTYNTKYKICNKCKSYYPLPNKRIRERRGCGIHTFKKGVCIYCHIEKKDEYLYRCYHI